jgi:hypothetical protein
LITGSTDVKTRIGRPALSLATNSDSGDPYGAVGCSTCKFGQVGSPQDVYRYHGIDTDGIVRAVLDLIE